MYSVRIVNLLSLPVNLFLNLKKKYEYLRKCDFNQTFSIPSSLEILVPQLFIHACMYIQNICYTVLIRKTKLAIVIICSRQQSYTTSITRTVKMMMCCSHDECSVAYYIIFADLFFLLYIIHVKWTWQFALMYYFDFQFCIIEYLNLRTNLGGGKARKKNDTTAQFILSTF